MAAKWIQSDEMVAPLYGPSLQKTTRTKSTPELTKKERQVPEWRLIAALLVLGLQVVSTAVVNTAELTRRADSGGWRLDSRLPQATHVVISVAQMPARPDVRRADLFATVDGSGIAGLSVRIPAEVEITAASSDTS